jgi:outer membrane receptor for ferrienterochelin and colicin
MGLFAFSAAATVLAGPINAAAADAVIQAAAADSQSGDDRGSTVVDDVIVRGHSSGSGPKASASGANDYGVTSQDIADLPTGATSALTDVLAQMPGVAIDQNQQIHIRNTEGPTFQYQINGVFVPFDINTNPPFLTMINPMFIKHLDLLDGILPARYGFATGGVVDMETKDGCEQPGGSVSILVGQRETVEPSAQFAGCAGKLSYYVSGLYDQGETAFSSATPGPNPIHDYTNQGQAFGYFDYQLDAKSRVSLVLSAAASNNQLPNVPGLAPEFTLAGVSNYQSANINSYLNFRDYLGILAFNGSTDSGLTYELAYSSHFISQSFRPDNAGELIFQGVASTATHYDIDNTLEGDVADTVGAHALSAGFYAGEYRVSVDDTSLVFPVDENGNQSCTTPETIINNIRATNVLTALYVNDLWRISSRLRANIGLRFDDLTGFTYHHQIDPTFNLSYDLTDSATVHAGVARYMQVPSFQGISPNASQAFAGTTAAGPPGISNPLTEDDIEWDAGIVYHLGRHVTLSQDGFYERTDHYLDTGQFGVIPIFAPFNYGAGYIWGSETAVNYRADNLSAYANLTIGRNWQKGVDTGQFNFDPDELAYINAHPIILDHQPLFGVSAGANYRLDQYTFGMDLIYSSGLRGGFADEEQLPNVVQLNASVERGFNIPGVGRLIDRLTLVNLADRTNLIRPAEGIGIFQSAYGPRFTVQDSLTLAF